MRLVLNWIKRSARGIRPVPVQSENVQGRGRENFQMNGRLSHDLLLLLSRLGGETEEQKILQRFQEGVNSLQQQVLLGEFSDSCEGPQLEVATARTRFGAFPLAPVGKSLGTEQRGDLATAAGLIASMMEGMVERRRFLEWERRYERDIEAAICEMRAERENLVELCNAARDALYLWETDAYGTLRCTQANVVAQRMLGYDEEELLDATPAVLVSSTGAPSVADYLEELKQSGRRFFQTTHYTRDGVAVPVEVAALLTRREHGETVVTSVKIVSI